jgi:hypothetical protein
VLILITAGAGVARCFGWQPRPKVSMRGRIPRRRADWFYRHGDGDAPLAAEVLFFSASKIGRRPILARRGAPDAALKFTLATSCYNNSPRLHRRERDCNPVLRRDAAVGNLAIR